MKVTAALLIIASSPVTLDAFTVSVPSRFHITTSPSSQQQQHSFTALFARDDKDTVVAVSLEQPVAINATATTAAIDEEKEQTKTQKMMQQVKDAGLAGVISYAIWELGFWAVSVPVCAFGYYEVTGHWPDLTNPDDQAKLGAEAFAFVNFARFAVPLRIGLALSTTPWMQTNVVDKFINKDGEVNSS